MGCSWAIAVALWWLLPAGVARVGLVGVPFPCGAGRTFGGFRGFEAWQTAALNAYKKPLLRPGGALEPLLWPCGGFCLRAWRVLSLLGYLFPAELGGLLEGLEGLRPGKRQPWTPIRSHCCGRGVLLSHCCGLVVAFACSVGRGKGSRKTGSTPPVVPGAAPALGRRI